MGVNFDRFPQESQRLIDELGVNNLLIRFRLDQMSELKAFTEWIQSFKNKNITIAIIYVPNLNKREYKEHIEKIFFVLSPYVKQFQIANAINRAKWGFFSVRAYLKFYRIAYKLVKSSYKDLKLLGPSVIDFEYHYTTQALFNLFLIRFHGLSAALYVDRAGSPENRQFGFNLLNKIDWLYSLIRLSPKCDNALYITEVNWPLIGSGDYAPTSEKECVSQDAMCNYMIRYYLLALSTAKVNAVYWHQLIAVAFGLVDPRKGLKKRTAFDAFKTMHFELEGASNIHLETNHDYYTLHYHKEGRNARIVWTNDTLFKLKLETMYRCISRDGQAFDNDTLTLSGEPIYIKGIKEEPTL